MTTVYDLRGPVPGTLTPLEKFPAAPYGLASSYCGDYLSESVCAPPPPST